MYGALLDVIYHSRKGRELRLCLCTIAFSSPLKMTIWYRVVSPDMIVSFPLQIVPERKGWMIL